MKNLNYWDECQQYLQEGAAQQIKEMDEADAFDCVKCFYPDQTDAAIDILTKENWLPAKGIVEFLLDKFPAHKSNITNWWIKIENKAADNWMKETGQNLFS